MNPEINEQVREAAMQIIHGGHFKDGKLPTVEEIAEIIERVTKASAYRRALVALKRSLDPHQTDPKRYELLRSDWDDLPIFDA